MKTISRTSMTSMNGVTLISWASGNSSSSSTPSKSAPPRLSPTEVPTESLRPACKSAAIIAIEVARQQTGDRAGRPADEVQIRFRRPHQVVVDDHRWNRGGETDGGRQQRFRNARRDHGEICRLGFGNANEAVHDAPHRAEQADKGAVDPILARTPMPYRAERASARTISAKRDAARAWIPFAVLSGDIRTSWIAAATSDAGRLLPRPAANWASVSVLVLATRASTLRNPRRARKR